MRLLLLALLGLRLLLGLRAVEAQQTTLTDPDSGATAVASIGTDADGDPSSTVTLSTLTGGFASTASATATASDTTVYPTYTNSGSIATFWATTPTTPVPTWTSSGAIEAATASVYTTDGATLTFTATTPTTPVPSVTSSGSVMNIRDYMAAQSAAGNGGAQKAHFIAPQTDLKSHAAPSFGRPRAPPPRWAALAVVVPVSAVLAGSIKWLL
ncbi:hypothetical protein JCM1841_000224 [Sporobolomyces salmonicolor]